MLKWEEIRDVKLTKHQEPCYNNYYYYSSSLTLTGLLNFIIIVHTCFHRVSQKKN